MSDVIVAKCVSIAIIFAGSLICGLLPAFRVFAAFPRFALSLILSYGGGILIATSLVHILPEARESWPESGFTAEMSLCVGIFIVYFVEELAHFLVCHDLHSPLGHHGEGDGHNHGVHVHHEEPPNRCDEPAAVYLFAEEMSRSGEHGHGHGHHHHHHHHIGHHHHCGSGGGGDGGGGGEQTQTKLFPTTTQSEPKIVPIGGVLTGGNNRKDGLEEKGGMTAATLRSLLGLIALSIHAGLEGLSVGLGKDASDVWYLCGAVAAHKLVIAFCLGMEVRNASSSPCTLVTTSSSASFKFRYVLFFALMTPVGIAIGTIITEFVNDPEGQTESTLVAVLQTLASGTLLYVAFFEVVLRERARFSGRGLAQLAAVILGFTTMALVEVYIGGHNHATRHDCHDHDHDKSNVTTTTLLPMLTENLLQPHNLTEDEKLIV